MSPTDSHACAGEPELTYPQAILLFHTLSAMNLLARSLMTALLCVGSLQAHAGKTLDAVRRRGTVQCGVTTGLAGFSAPDAQGRWHGLDVDVCRAVAAAVLGDADKVTFVALNAQQRFTALQSGQIDVLSRNTSWTLTRDASLGLSFTAITYYDGQGFLVPKKLKVTSAKQLKGAQVCAQSGTTNEKNLADYSRVAKLGVKPLVFDSYEAAFKALSTIRNKEASRPDDYVILPELISKEPLGPVVRRGDDEWLSIVKWTVFALQNAEELGVTKANVVQQKNSDDPAIQRLLGTFEDTGKLLGLDKAWAFKAIQSVGNYGEVFERNVGAQSALKLPRGLNRLWTQGGLVYAPPVR
jgi:general L-amino acid transport system substrate-binding protein